MILSLSSIDNDRLEVTRILPTLTTTTSSSAASASLRPPNSRSPSRGPTPRQEPSSSLSRSKIDASSDKATAAFIRRTLCSAHHAHGSAIGEKGRNTPLPVHDLLPSLTSSNDVDLQLYAFLSIIVRDFVLSWYGRITPDQEFIGEVLKIVAHCSRALEERCRRVDWVDVALEKLPRALNDHVTGMFLRKIGAGRLFADSRSI